MTRYLGVVLGLALSAVLPSATTTVSGGVVTSGGKPVADAVVWLDAPDAPKTPPRAEAVLEQRNLEFYPHVLAVQVGTRVKFPNNDRVLHNVFSYHEGKPFDLGLYPVGTVKVHPFDQVGLSRVFCNIHSQMAAYVMVVDTPYFAVSDSAGRFTLREIPVGAYHYHAWRPGGTVLNDVVDVKPGFSFEVRLP
jgi:plastocyanin